MHSLEARPARELATDVALSDAAVVSRVLAGDVAMFEVLMRRHNQRVYRAVRSLLRNEAEAEDAMQDAYVSAYEHLDQFQGNSAFSTWLIRIAINAALAKLRGRARLVPLDGEPPGDPMDFGRTAPAPDAERRAAAREAVTLLEGALDELPDIYRSTFMLRELEGLDTAATAEALGVTEDVIKTRLHRAKLSLKDALFDRVGESANDLFRFEAPRCDRIVAGVMARIAQR